jgi:prepilin-type N-terminal cleavage/methylation domain-containing protein
MIRQVRKRAGFTLLELLVVIAIITLLVALSFGAIMRVRVAQQVRSSVTTVQKVQSAVDNRYKAITAQAVIDIRTEATQDAQAMINYFNGDKDAALALLTYARVRQAFPQTFAEVNLPNTFPNPNNPSQTIPYFVVGNYIYPVKSEFLSFYGMAPGTLQPWQQSAALLYAAVSQTGAGGSTFASDDSTSANQADFAQAGAPTLRVYMDSWQQPIGYSRFGTNVNGPAIGPAWNTGKQVQSLQDPPNVSQNPTINLLTKTPLNDPLDPAGKLQNWPWSNNLQWTPLFALAPADPANATTFDGTNRRPVVYSVGPNGQYESLNMTKATSSSSDDIMGYQYTQLGQSGIR